LIGIFVIALLAVAQDSFEIDDEEAKFHPMLDVESVLVINPSDQIRIGDIAVSIGLGGHPQQTEGNYRRHSGRERSGDPLTLRRDGFFCGLVNEFSGKEHVLRSSGASKVCVASRVLCGYSNFSRYRLADVLRVYLIQKQILESGRGSLVASNRRFDLDPCALINPEGFHGLTQITFGNPSLPSGKPCGGQGGEECAGRQSYRELIEPMFFLATFACAGVFGLYHLLSNIRTVTVRRMAVDLGLVVVGWCGGILGVIWFCIILTY
jgi:hypothetical protein